MSKLPYMSVALIIWWVTLPFLLTMFNVNVNYDGEEGMNFNKLQQDKSKNPFDYLNFFYKMMTYDINGLILPLRVFLVFINYLAPIMLMMYLRGVG